MNPPGDLRALLVSWITPDQAPCQEAAVLKKIVDAARVEGLAGLILESHGQRLRSRWALDRLRAAASQVAADNLQYLGELSRIAGAFRRAGVPLMALKGAALNLTVYPRMDLRPMTDLDLLVQPGHAREAVRLLESVGYTKGASLLREDFFPGYHYEQELIGPDPQVVRVDLHAHPWRPMHLAQVVSPQEFWRGARTVAVGDSEVMVPGLETMLIHLAAHAAFHGCSRLIWLYDLKRLIAHSHGRLDWDAVVDKSDRWEVSAALDRALGHAEVLLGPVCPTHIRARLAEIPAAWRQRLSLWHAPKDAASPVVHVICNVACLYGLRARLAYLAAMLLPGRAHLGGLYPFRHFGWRCCAHVVRAARAVIRGVASLGALARLRPTMPEAAC